MQRNRRVLGVTMVFLVCFMTLTACKKAEETAKKWSYEDETGPEHWGDLKPEFAPCEDGTQQSPIDITGATAGTLDSIFFDYQSSPLRLVNNGHTLQINYVAGSSITIGEKQYHLLQFHFHSPSEHTVDGKPYDMVMHLVHQNADGQLAVVGVFIQKGQKNDAIQLLWDNFPAVEKKEAAPTDITVAASQLLPADRTYYSYPGSLTTPPCSEGVKWMVLKTPIEVSEQQVAKFVSVFEHSARPVQPLNDRQVLVSDNNSSS